MKRSLLFALAPALFAACSSSAVSDAGFPDAQATPPDAGAMDVGAAPDSGAEPTDSGTAPADTGAEPADTGTDAGAEPVDSGADAGAAAGDGGIQCGQPFLIDQDPASNLLGRLGVYAATGQATALSYTNLDDYSDHVLFHDGTSSTALELLFTAAEFNGSGSGGAPQGAARAGYAAFIAPRRINDGSGVVARRSITGGTWTGPAVGRRFGGGVNALAIRENGEVLISGPTNLRRQLAVVSFDLAGSLSATVALTPFAENISDTYLALGAQDNGAVFALTVDGVIHGYAIRGGAVSPTSVDLAPPVGVSGLVAAPLPGGDVYVVWGESGIGATTRGTIFHYDTGSMTASFGATDDIAPNSARLDLKVDADGNLTLLRGSGGHLLVYRRIAGAWSAAMDFGIGPVNGPETLALDAEGTAYVTYLDSDVLYLSRAPALSTTWVTPTRIAMAPSSNSHAIGAIGARGVVVTYNVATLMNGGTDVYGIICR
ncbi:MAG: hypothetical protein U1E65_26290 [Myxococcota bacterium]